MSYAPIYSEELLEPVIARKNSSVISASKSTTRARRRSPGRANGSTHYSPIIVHCHLCWDWVWQRPQQFLSRLSRKHKILFIETLGPDPTLAAPLARYRQLEDYPNMTVLRLQFPAWCWGDSERIDRERRRLVKEFLAGPVAGQFDRPVQWFYDPMAVTPFAEQMDEILTVYDCMDELAKFAGAPPQIAQRELELLSRADVVFTGGRRLFESKSRYNDNCHFYGCGVDGQHFGKARRAETKVPRDLARIRKPVLGYFGVVDERMDYELVAALAEANPEWSVAMVGPVMKVDESTLPRRANLHWLGKRSYDELPALCRGFDVCLMPFALNEATEFINPTKALEYMATGRQIVSTAVSDVVRNFGSIVKIAKTRAEFVRLCRDALDSPDQEAVARGLQMAAENSWDSIVDRLEGHLQEALKIRAAA